MTDRADGSPAVAAGARVVHAECPIIPSPSGLPSQHLVTASVGAEHVFVGQQWLEPGQRVLLHTHPVEEVLVFLAGQGEARLGEASHEIGQGISLHIPAGIPHGFRNTGDVTLHVMIVFPVPEFAETTLLE